MKKIISLSISILLGVTSLLAQMKVANYSVGKPGTDKYEHLDFWTNNGKRTQINYSYGKDQKEVKMQYSGVDLINDDTCFKIRFTNNYTLFVIQKGLQLRVIDSAGKYDKTFSWEYEGPVNGVGTYCDVCAENDEEAMKLIELAYLR